MALPVLDGNQTATTLSSVVTGGEHIVAHSVVSLGANAIANITSAVSGSVVSISNFPSTQTIAGTVTAYAVGKYAVGGPVFQDKNIATDVSGQTLINATVNAQSVFNYDGTSHIFAKLTPNTTVTIGSLPAISGTVTANANYEFEAGGPGQPNNAIQIGYYKGSVFEPVTEEDPLPISGTVTAAAPNGSLTTRFGTPTTANVSFATSAVTNANRKYLLIQNVTTGSNVITVGIGFTPTTTQGIQLTAGAGITFESSYIPTGAVYVLSSVTASNFTILEA